MDFAVVIINTLVFTLFAKYSIDTKQTVLLTIAATFLAINIVFFINMFVLQEQEDLFDNIEI